MAEKRLREMTALEPAGLKEAARSFLAYAISPIPGTAAVKAEIEANNERALYKFGAKNVPSGTLGT
jgi:hypothetical protein